MSQPIGPTHTPTEWVARLATLVHTLRTDWDEAGIRATLHRIADRPLIDVTAAAINACRRVDARTPAVIAMDGDHWPKPRDAQRTYTESGIVTFCEHGEPGTSCPICHPRRFGSGVLPTAEQRAQIRAALHDDTTTERTQP